MRSRKTSRSEFSDALFKVALSPPGEDDLVLGGRDLQRENDCLPSLAPATDNQIFMATEIQDTMSQNIYTSDTELLGGADLANVNSNGQLENRRFGEIRQKLTR